MCGPAIDSKSGSAISSLASGASFAVDGTYANLSFGGEYLGGDSAGNLYGRGARSWTAALGGHVTGPPRAISGDDVLAPAHGATASASNTCGSDCVAFFEFGLSAPDCYMQANGSVTAAPAPGVNYPAYVYFGDSSGKFFAYDGTCTQKASQSLPQAVISSPIVFDAGINKPQTDEIFALLADSTKSQLAQFDFSSGKNGTGFTAPTDTSLGTPSAVGLAVDGTSLPARVAITFAGGMVRVLQISTSFTVSTIASRQLPSGIADAPAWYGSGANGTVGVAGQNGTLYLMDGSLGSLRSYALGGSIQGSPVADGQGDWFVGNDNGTVDEVPAIGSPQYSTLAFGGGQLGSIQSSVQVAPCNGGAWLCAYAPSTNGDLYGVNLSARDVVISACISTVPPACASDNPRLWVSAQVGSEASNKTVHVQGWSYYSP